MSEHRQEKYKCNVCKREFVVDINSFGVTHQDIVAVTCLVCAEKVGGNIK